MKRFYILVIALFVTASMLADRNGIKLTFSNIKANATTPTNITVNIGGIGEQSANNITASLVYCNSNLKDSGGALAGDTTLQANVTTNGFQNPNKGKAIYIFAIKGLHNNSFNEINLGIEALDSKGEFQSRMTRAWNLTAELTSSNSELNSTQLASYSSYTSVASVENVNIADVYINNINYKKHMLIANQQITITENNILYLKITLEKNDGIGCFAGLSNIELYDNASPTIALHSGNDNKYYASICYPANISIHSGSSAYTINSVMTEATSETYGYLKLNQINPESNGNTIIPKNTAVILIGDKESIIGTYDYINTYDVITNNLLQCTQGLIGTTGQAASSSGGSESTLTTADYYLGFADNTPGFYKVRYTDTNTPSVTYKGYLPSSSITGQSSKGFVFAFADDDPTGINNATEKNAGSFDANAPRYDLKGMRVGKDYKGIIIINGKKYLIM